ncbi:hypothetical protein B23_0778 [Geobacillus thermoleovorans B23]|nr:hypothetical protein B23_0778 [Geobacillus thermoleovorans B23]
MILQYFANALNEIFQCLMDRIETLYECLDTSRGIS